jgi:glutathione S-transferase
VQFDLAAYPNVAAHRARVFDRPAAGRAFAEEFALYRAG